MNASQIQAVAANAGFTGPDLATAVAIALAESNGNELSYNPETAAGTPAGQGSYGLWQIYLKLHPEFAGENLYDPQTNANAAFAIWDAAGGFHPWSTYNSGKFQAYLSQVPQPAAPAATFVNAEPGPGPLVLDAATGLPVSSTPEYASFVPVPATAPTIGDYLLWGALGLFALWIFEQAS